MSFAVGIGAGIGCGIACGISAGRSQARKEVAAHLGRLTATGELRVTDADDRPITIDALLDDVLPSREVESRRVLIAAVVLGVLMLAGVLVFVSMSG